MRDFYLRLPVGTALKQFTIVPTADNTSPLIQRAVVLLLIHDDASLTVNGESFMSVLRSTTSSAIHELSKYLSPVADALRDMLNESEDSVSAVEFILQNIDNKLRLDINITEVTGDVQTAVIYQES